MASNFMVAARTSGLASLPWRLNARLTISKLRVRDTETLRKRAFGSYAQALTTRMPDARISPIPDAGHIPHLDQPGPVAAVLNEFLRRPCR
jgi:pimeloyl-ACP methyl ester carboxylesterase